MPLSVFDHMDADGDGMLSIGELIREVGRADAKTHLALLCRHDELLSGEKRIIQDDKMIDKQEAINWSSKRYDEAFVKLYTEDGDRTPRNDDAISWLGQAEKLLAAWENPETK